MGVIGCAWVRILTYQSVPYRDILTESGLLSGFQVSEKTTVMHLENAHLTFESLSTSATTASTSQIGMVGASVHINNSTLAFEFGALLARLRRCLTLRVVLLCFDSFEHLRKAMGNDTQGSPISCSKLVLAYLQESGPRGVKKNKAIGVNLTTLKPSGMFPFSTFRFYWNSYRTNNRSDLGFQRLRSQLGLSSASIIPNMDRHDDEARYAVSRVMAVSRLDKAEQVGVPPCSSVL